MTDVRNALLIARPGYMRSGLQALLAASGLVDRVILAHDSMSALQQAATVPIAMALLDGDLPGSALPVLGRLHREYPGLRCLFLATTSQQQAMALAACADGVLLRGCSTAELHQAIGQLLGAGSWGCANAAGTPARGTVSAGYGLGVRCAR